MTLSRAARSVLLVALLLTGCRARGEVGVLPYYPGAQVVTVSESQGKAFGFGPAAWRRVDLTARDSYARVRMFYADIRPEGWTSTLTNETTKETGRRYDRYLADARRREFYAIQIWEQAEGTVHITLAWGRRRGSAPTR